VPAIPEAPIAVAAPAPVAPPAPRRDDAAVAAYRAALSDLAARRLDEALAGLDAFLRAHPRHPYADNALYWRAEIHYARRDYRGALVELSALIERYPSGNKVPDALLRIGLCHERMGDRARARQVFQRLRTQYPDSVAARMASREDV
jgi:tol-pal system protein YbgF